MTSEKKYIQLNGKLIDLSSPLLMGIINITSDSFYEKSRTMDIRKIIDRARLIVEQGGDIIDIGACSTRPGSEAVSEEEEILRLLPAVKVIKRLFPDVPISIDTFRSSVARVIYDRFGDFIINDISGGTMDKKMFRTVADLQLPYILTHIKGVPKTMQQETRYDSLIKEIIQWMGKQIDELQILGVKDIIVDPGFGFGKTVEQNYEILARLRDFKTLGLPVLAGISRKSMIYNLLGKTPEESLGGTIATQMIALGNGANILRVHDVEAAKETLTIYRQLQPYL